MASDSSQSAARVATTPTTDHCTMKVMRRTVANKLATYWQVVCQHLGYTPQQFRRENDKKSLIAVLECWVAAGEREGRPKTWPQFISVITDINSSISGEICDSLRTKGVWTALPTMKSPDLPVKRQPQLVQDDLSSITEVTDGGITKNGHVQPTNQPAPRVTPPPVEWKCDIKTMYMCGVKKLAPYWITVADFLDYSVAEKEKFRCDDNKSSLVAVLEDWITTDNGREPKTWSTFAKVLTEVDEDQSISLGHEIYVKLQSKGVLILPNTSPVPNHPLRSSSYSTPPARHGHGRVLKPSHSFPAYNQAMKTPHHQQPLKDIQRELMFDEIPEENTEQSSKVIPKQSYDTHHMSLHGQNFASSASRHPPPSTPGLHYSPSPSYQSTTPSQNYRPGAPSPGYRSTTPSHNFRSMIPSQCHASMVQSQCYGSTTSSQNHGSMAPPQGCGSMTPPQGHRSMFSSQDHDHGLMFSLQGQQSISTSHSYRLMTSSHGYESMAPSQGHEFPSQGHGSKFSSQGYQSMDPSQCRASSQGHESMAPSQGHGSMTHSQIRRSMAHLQGRGSVANSRGRGSMVPLQGRGSIAHSQGRGSMHLSESFPQMNPPQGYPSMPRLQHMPFSQPADSYMYHSMQQQVYQPRPIHPNSRRHAMQRPPVEPQYGNADVTMTTTTPASHTAAMTTTTKSSAAVVSTTTRSGATGSATSSATSTSSGGSHFDSSSTTRECFFVRFSKTPHISTQSDPQPTSETSNTKSYVAEDNIDLSSPSNNLSVANDKITPPINVNPPTIQTATNSNVALVSSHNQSTQHATLSPNVEVPIVPAPFKWRKGRILGSGAFGRVFLCTDESNNRILAVKEVDIDPNLTKDAKKAVESLEKEIKILKNVKHDRIVQYYGTQRNKECVCIFMEYMEGGSLYHYIDKMGALKEFVASDYTRQLLEGVEYLHVKEIIHRDIKGANILMDHNRNIKIADFGASKLLRSLYLSVKIQDKKTAIQNSSNQTKKSVAGTAYWMAPEVIRGETVDHGADIWSVGCTVVEMLTCHPPYTHLETFAAMYKIATEPMCYNIPEESSKHVHHFLSQCFKSKISERPAASTLLKHQFVQRSTCSDDVAPDGGTPAAFSMASSDQQQQQAAGCRTIDSVSTLAPQSETDMDTLIPAMPDASFTGSSSTAANDIQSSYPTSQGTILTATPSQVGLASDADATSSSAVVTGVAASSDQSSSPAGNGDDDDDDDTPDDDDALDDNNFDGDDISKAKAEQCSTSKDTTTIEPQSETADGVASTATYTDCTTAATTADTDRRDGFGGPQVQQTTAESSYTSDSYSARAGYASNINNNSTPLKSLPVKPTEPSNECMQDPAWKIKHQEMQNGFISNIFCNFPQQSEDTPAGGHTVQVVQFIVQGHNMVPTTALSSLPIFDTHNSLEPFAQEICCSVNIQAIFPWMIKHGLLTRYDQEYFMSPSHIPMEKRHKLTCLVISLNEECVEKFLDCLSQTAVDYAPHDYLLKKIQSGRVKPSESH